MSAQAFQLSSLNQSTRAGLSFCPAEPWTALCQTAASLRDIEALIPALRAIHSEHFSDLTPPPPLRVVADPVGNSHPHATTLYGLLQRQDVANAITDLIRAKELGARELNFHIPWEIQFSDSRDEYAGNAFMDLVDSLGAALQVASVWENAPLVVAPDWRLVRQVEFIPQNRNLCLDIGHLMLGSRSREEALDRIDRFLDTHTSRIRHLHLHVNDFVCDQHRNDPAVVENFLGSHRFTRLLSGRTYIFEPMSS